MESSAEYLEYFLSRTHLFLLETLALEGHTASGCLRVPAVSQGTENGMEPGPSGSIPDFAPLCSHLLHSMFPFGSTGAQSRALNPGTGRHLLQNLLFGLGAGKALGSLRALPQAVSVGASLSPHSGPTAHRVSPCQWHCQDPLPWQGAPLVWAQVPGGCQGAQEGAGTVTAPQGPRVL